MPTQEQLFGSVQSTTKSVVVWLKACADCWAAAALYEELSRLSDAELRKRGLSRDKVGRHALKLCTLSGQLDARAPTIRVCISVPD
jgi:hypothetical protein